MLYIVDILNYYVFICKGYVELTNWIPVEKAILDLLREYDLTIEDLLVAMKDVDIDVYGELVRRLSECTENIMDYIYSLSWKTAALLLFTIQSLYIINTSGLYKGYKLYPPRSSVIIHDKVDFNGLVAILTQLKKII